MRRIIIAPLHDVGQHGKNLRRGGRRRRLEQFLPRVIWFERLAPNCLPRVIGIRVGRSFRWLRGRRLISISRRRLRRVRCRRNQRQIGRRIGRGLGPGQFPVRRGRARTRQSPVRIYGNEKRGLQHQRCDESKFRPARRNPAIAKVRRVKKFPRRLWPCEKRAHARAEIVPRLSPLHPELRPFRSEESHSAQPVSRVSDASCSSSADMTLNYTLPIAAGLSASVAAPHIENHPRSNNDAENASVASHCAIEAERCIALLDNAHAFEARNGCVGRALLCEFGDHQPRRGQQF